MPKSKYMTVKRQLFEDMKVIADAAIAIKKHRDGIAITLRIVKEVIQKYPEVEAEIEAKFKELIEEQEKANEPTNTT